MQEHPSATAQEHLDLLRVVAGTVLGTRPLKEDLVDHARRVCEVLQTDFCVMRRLRGDRLDLIASYGIPEEQLEETLEGDFGLGRRIIDTKTATSVNDVHEDAESQPYLRRPKAIEFTSYAGAPMLVGSVVMGILGVFTYERKRVFHKADLDVLTALANHLMVAIRNHELFEELNQLNADLDQRVNERTAELEAANRELEAFTYTVAHDLRAPLRGIVSNCQILVEDFGEQLPQGSHAYIERQSTSAKRLANMMDGLLALTRIGRHEVQKSQMNLSRMAEELSLEFIRMNNVNTPRFSVEPDIIVGADPRLVRVLLQNLFENAVKFAKADEPAMINVRTDNSDPTVSFIVEDKGIGFEPQFAEKVFQPFERLVRENDYPGTGIGLASVKRIVEKHRGTIEAIGDPGVGAAFKVRL